MANLQVKGIDYELSADQRLLNLAEWSEDVAKALAQREGLTLTPAHMEILGLMREFYATYNIPPVRKLLRKLLAERYGPDRAADEYLAALFPNGVLVQGTRLAGLPAPMLDAELERTHYATGSAPDPGKVKYFVSEFEFEGRRLKVHPKGNLADPEQWDERLAEFMARKEDITLSPEHWEVIRFLRKFYFQYGISPMVRLLIAHMREHFGPDKSSRQYLYGLFPDGPARQGSRIAGLPEPQGCIDP